MLSCLSMYKVLNSMLKLNYRLYSCHGLSNSSGLLIMRTSSLSAVDCCKYSVCILNEHFSALSVNRYVDVI